MFKVGDKVKRIPKYCTSNYSFTPDGVYIISGFGRTEGMILLEDFEGEYDPDRFILVESKKSNKPAWL